MGEKYLKFCADSVLINSSLSLIPFLNIFGMPNYFPQYTPLTGCDLRRTQGQLGPWPQLDYPGPALLSSHLFAN